MSRVYTKETINWFNTLDIEDIVYLSPANGQYSDLISPIHNRKYISDTKVKIDRSKALIEQRERCFRAYATYLTGSGKPVDPNIIEVIKNA